MPTVLQEDRKFELTLLIQAVDELKNMGEVKVTEWLRGVTKNDPSAYNKVHQIYQEGGGECSFARFLLLVSSYSVLNQLLLEQVFRVLMLY